MINDLVREVEALGNERTKKRYISQGAQEPLFGLTIKALKPIAKRLKKNDNCQQIAYELYDTGNYDLMYLAGMIVDPHQMDTDKFNDWIQKAYFYMISDYIVAVCLSETGIAFEIADRWIQSNQDLISSAGYSTYSWMLASRDDGVFEAARIQRLLELIRQSIHETKNRTGYAMYYFVYNVGVSFLPLHENALDIANTIGEISVETNGKIHLYFAEKDIRKAIEKNQIGFKRKYVRC